MTAGSREEFEKIWAAKVRAAQKRYAEASNEFRKVWAENFDAHLATDPALAIRQARQAESKALDEYMRVLKVFTDLVLHNKMPADAE